MTVCIVILHHKESPNMQTAGLTPEQVYFVNIMALNCHQRPSRAHIVCIIIGIGYNNIFFLRQFVFQLLQGL